MQEKLNQLWELSEGYGNDFQPDVEKGLRGLHAKMKHEPRIVPVRKISSRRKWLQYAAAIAVLVSAAWFINNVWTANPATEMAWETIHTTDQKHEIILPDGTSVSLNKNTTLQYNTNMVSAATRQIRLEGEAFFDVYRNEKQAFLIETAFAEVKVLGTSFNVRTYEKEAFTEVEVSSGKVAFSNLGNTQTVDLTVNEMATINSSGNLLKKEVIALNRSAWKTQKLSFKNTRLGEVVPMLERAFDVDINWKSSTKNCPITADWEEESLTNVISNISRLNPAIHIKKINDSSYEFIGACK